MSPLLHDALTIGLPTAAIIVGILFNDKRFDRIEGRLDWMQADLSQFYKTLGEHEGRIEMLSKKA